MEQPNVAVWFEIPAADHDRAIGFYESVFLTELRREKFGNLDTAVFPHVPEATSGCLIHGDGYAPSTQGTIAYLNLADDLARPLARVPDAGGSVLVAKTALPCGGYFAVFHDSEGNRVGLFSPR